MEASDLHFLREEREAELRSDPRMHQWAARMKQEELDIIRRVDCTIVHSTFEQALLAREVPEASVTVFGGAMDVPGTNTSFEARRDVAFIGGYQHPPNVDGALVLRPRDFAAGAAAVARRPVSHHREQPARRFLALQGEAIRVAGFVPDLGPMLDRVRLSVAPLRYGAGIKFKICTSMSHGLPCVATPLAAEGMALVAEREVLVASTPAEFASAVVRAVHGPGPVEPPFRERLGVRAPPLFFRGRDGVVRRSARVAGPRPDRFCGGCARRWPAT